MQKHRQITIERLDKFTSTNQWSDVNLSFLLWKNHIQIDSFEFYGPCFNRPCFADAIKATFEATTRSDLIMSPSWSTYWIHLYLQIPLSFKGDRVFLLFDPNCEALFYNVDGLPLQGITGGSGGDRHVDVLLSDHAVGGEKFEFYIEIACNGMFGNPGSEAGIITAPIPNRQFSISTFSISAANKSAQKLLTDFELIRGMAKDMPSNSQISSDALYTANAIVNAVHADDPSTIEAGLTISNNFFSSRVNYCHADHLLTATGHCHIDTAWLWPYAETVRKCARSFATQINLMDRYPDYKFSCSQAQQYEWIEEQYPLLFARIQEKVKNNQFIPVGGTWIEMDCNVPSGESFCRQFLYGQKYFESRFGKRHDVFWLPDTFGYSSQLPQIVKESDLKYFYTQKLSWNNINKFPHTTFNWVGSDGTSVLTHFSPTDTVYLNNFSIALKELFVM